jgi:uncharacterized delta-60 repeat protein
MPTTKKPAARPDGPVFGVVGGAFAPPYTENLTMLRAGGRGVRWRGICRLVVRGHGHRRWRRAIAPFAAQLALSAVALPGVSTNAGSLDPSFGQGGYTTVPLGAWVGAAAVAVQPDGRIVTAGEANIDGANVIVSTRMTGDGRLDSSYGSGGIVTVDINGNAGVDSGAGLALQPDGKIVIAGTGASGATSLTFAAVRLLPDGSRDASFGADGIVTVPIGGAAIANAVVVQPDGKIALGGTALTDHSVFAAVRLNPNGTPDTSFGTNGTITLGPAAGAWGMALQGDGKLVLGGQTVESGADEYIAARLLPDGAPDDSFGHAGIVTIPIGSTADGLGIALQPDDKILLTGSAYTDTAVAATARLNPDGSLDPTFGSGGIASVPDWYAINGITLDSSRRIVLPAVGASALRLNPDGGLDQSFGTDGNALVRIGTNDAANGAAIEPDGDIVLAGAATIDGRVVLSVIRLTAGAAVTSPLSTIPPVVGGGIQTVKQVVVPPPSNIAHPAVNGTNKEGQALTATNGAWTQAPTAFAYQWQQCDPSGAGCRNIASATGTRYTPNAFDVGHALRAIVVATNRGGSMAAASPPTAAIVSNKPKLSSVRLTPSPLKPGKRTKLSLKISEPATVTLVIAHRVTGRAIHGKCKPKARKGKRCTLTATNSRFTFHAIAGPNNFTFRLPKLRPGRYTTTITAKTGTGETSRPVNRYSTIKSHKHGKHG